MKVKCTICNKSFHYGDSTSPMFVNEIWDKIVTYFKLADFEREAAKRFYIAVKQGKKDYRPDHHVFICSECAERALGRKIVDTDINDSKFNIHFRKRYFGSKFS